MSNSALRICSRFTEQGEREFGFSGRGKQYNDLCNWLPTTSAVRTADSKPWMFWRFEDLVEEKNFMASYHRFIDYV